MFAGRRTLGLEQLADRGGDPRWEGALAIEPGRDSHPPDVRAVVRERHAVGPRPRLDACSAAAVSQSRTEIVLFSVATHVGLICNNPAALPLLPQVVFVSASLMSLHVHAAIGASSGGTSSSTAGAGVAGLAPGAAANAPCRWGRRRRGDRLPHIPTTRAGCQAAGVPYCRTRNLFERGRANFQSVATGHRGPQFQQKEGLRIHHPVSST